MVRILHVVSSLNINAGMMSVVMNYYRHIDRSKIQFDFLYFFEMEQNHAEEIKKLGGRVFCLGKPSFGLGYHRKLKEFFREHRGEYTIVHCHPIWTPQLVALSAKKYGAKIIIAHSHSTKFSDNKLSAIRNRIINTFIGFFATNYIACSPEAAYLFGKDRVAKGDVFILKNAIELDKYRYDQELREKVRNEFSIDDTTFVVGNVGRLCIQKNQQFLLEIFKLYLKINPNSKLMIVGDGELREIIFNKIKELSLEDKVIMTGKRSDIKAILSAMDVFVMPSLFEGAPVSAIEAMSNGLNIVLSDTITTSIENELTSYCSLEAGAGCWAKSIANTVDKEHQRDLLNDFIQSFDISNEALRLEQYYLNLI